MIPSKKQNSPPLFPSPKVSVEKYSKTTKTFQFFVYDKFHKQHSVNFHRQSTRTTFFMTMYKRRRKINFSIKLKKFATQESYHQFSVTRKEQKKKKTENSINFPLIYSIASQIFFFSFIMFSLLFFGILWFLNWPHFVCFCIFQIIFFMSIILKRKDCLWYKRNLQRFFVTSIRL